MIRLDARAGRLHRRNLALVLTLAGCAHGTLTPSTGLPERFTGPVATVAVTVDPTIPTDRLAAYRDLDGERTIRDAIVTQLTKASAWNPSGDTQLTVTVTTFRLRSTGNAFWNGYFAGVDRLEGQVEAQRAGAPAQRYAFRLSGSEELYFKFSRSARFRSLARALANRIAKVVERGA